MEKAGLFENGIFTYILEAGPKWIGAFIIIVITFYIARIVASKLDKYIEDSTHYDEQRKEMVLTASRIAKVIIIIIGVVIALDVVGVLGNLGWLLGSVGLGIGFGLKNILGNFIAGIGILLQDKTNVGDIIEVGDNLGKILEIGSRTTTVRQLDGVEIIIPNSEFFEKPVKIYTANPFRRLLVSMGVGYDTDFTLAEKVAREIMGAHPSIEKKPDPLFLVSSIDNSTVKIELKFWVKSTLPWWSIQSEILKDWFVKSQEVGIDISYPITTLRVDDRESALLGDYMKKTLKPKT